MLGPCGFTVPHRSPLAFGIQTVTMLRPLQTIKFLAAWAVPWKPAFQTSAKASGLKFHVSCRDVTGRHLAKYGGHEPEITSWIARHLRASAPAIVVDIGANIGWHTIHAATIDTVQTVVAFEPDAFNGWLLDRNLTANNVDNVIVERVAVGARPDVARLHRYKASNNGRHSMIAAYGLGSTLVPVVTLDGVLQDLGLADRPISLIKIDVEGFEPSVIAGGLKAIERAGAILTEVSPDLSKEGGLSVDDMVAQLLTAGFVPHRLQDNGALQEIKVRDLVAIKGQLDVIWLRPQ